MAGLILSALGQGIQRAGAAYADAGLRQEERRMAEESADRRAEQAEIRKEQRVEKAAKRDADAYSSAQQSAEGAGFERRFSKFKADLGQTDMTDEQAREVFRQNYDDKAVNAEPGGDRYLDRYSQKKADILNELRKGGQASSTLITSAAKDVADTQRAEADAAKEARIAQRDAEKARLDAARFDETARANRESERIREINARRSGGSGSGPKPGDLTEQENKRIDLARDDIKAIDSELKAERERKVYGTKEREAQSARIAELTAQRADARRALDSLIGGSKPEAAKPESKPEAPKPAAAKKPPAIAAVQGAPAGATIGAQVPGKGWEVKDRNGRLIGYAKD